MTRDFFGLLILLKLILYSKYEYRHKRHPESYIATVFRWLIPRHEARVQTSLSGHTVIDLSDSQLLRLFIAIPSTLIDRTLAQLLDRRSTTMVTDRTIQKAGTAREHNANDAIVPKRR